MIKQKKVTMIIHSTGIGYVTLGHRKNDGETLALTLTPTLTQSNTNRNQSKFISIFYVFIYVV